MMPVILFIAAVLLMIYAILIGRYRMWWKEIPTFTAQAVSATKVTVIIPARNEENNIGRCLNSVLAQNYPKHLLEVIVVDDFSTDNTAAIVQAFPEVRLLQLSNYVKDPINSYKKKAIEIAIATSTGDLIITTDADCIAGSNWVTTIAAFYDQQGATFIAAGVKIKTTGSLLSIFQSLDFLTLQGITGASVHKRFHSMCNGANMAYEKKVFYEVDGFQGIDRIASGDDMLLMHKIFLKHPDRVFFLKNADTVVTTEPAITWKTFLQQRIRWASKADKYDDKRIFAVLLLVYFLNLILLAVIIMCFFDLQWLPIAIALLVVKCLIEYPFMWTISAYFGMRPILGWFPLIQPLHIAYTVIAGFLGKFGTYQWKGRSVR